MGKEKNEKINVNEYIQAHVPDKARLATLLSEAKGSDRTMAEFAAACGVSASTFSRILNYKMTRPLDRDLIVLIAENADKRCFDALERLLQANGMISPDRQKEEEEHKKEYGSFKTYEELKDERKIIKNTLMNELLSRGITLQYLRGSEFRARRKNQTDPEFDIPVYSDYAFECNRREEPQKIWSFIDVDRLGPSFTKVVSLGRFFRDYATVFLADEWVPESLATMKTSFIVTDRKDFDTLTDSLSRRKFNTEMSVILINIEEQKVVTEKFLPMKNREVPESVFDLELIEDDEDNWGSEDK